MQGPWEHHTVLLEEAIQALQLRPEGSYIDATFGRGGHSRLILSALSPQGRLLAFDKDPQAVAEGQRLAVAFVQAHPHWRLSLQSHKWLGVR